MIHYYDNDAVETVVEHGVCAHHIKHPGSNFAGCTCWSHYTTRRRDPNSTETVRNTHKRSPIGTVHTNPDRIDVAEQLRIAGDDLADLLAGIASSRLDSQQKSTVDKYLDKWNEARRGQ